MKHVIKFYINGKELLYTKRKVYTIDNKFMIKLYGVMWEVSKKDLKIGDVTTTVYYKEL